MTLGRPLVNQRPFNFNPLNGQTRASFLRRFRPTVQVRSQRNNTNGFSKPQLRSKLGDRRLYACLKVSGQMLGAAVLGIDAIGDRLIALVGISRNSYSISAFE